MMLNFIFITYRYLNKATLLFAVQYSKPQTTLVFHFTPESVIVHWNESFIHADASNKTIVISGHMGINDIHCTCNFSTWKIMETDLLAVVALNTAQK